MPDSVVVTPATFRDEIVPAFGRRGGIGRQRGQELPGRGARRARRSLPAGVGPGDGARTDEADRQRRRTHRSGRRLPDRQHLEHARGCSRRRGRRQADVPLPRAARRSDGGLPGRVRGRHPGRGAAPRAREPARPRGAPRAPADGSSSTRRSRSRSAARSSGSRSGCVSATAILGWTAIFRAATDDLVISGAHRGRCRGAGHGPGPVRPGSPLGGARGQPGAPRDGRGAGSPMAALRTRPRPARGRRRSPRPSRSAAAPSTPRPGRCTRAWRSRCRPGCCWRRSMAWVGGTLLVRPTAPGESRRDFLPPLPFGRVGHRRAPEPQPPTPILGARHRHHRSRTRRGLRDGPGIVRRHLRRGEARRRQVRRRLGPAHHPERLRHASPSGRLCLETHRPRRGRRDPGRVRARELGADRPVQPRQAEPRGDRACDASSGSRRLPLVVDHAAPGILAALAGDPRGVLVDAETADDLSIETGDTVEVILALGTKRETRRSFRVVGSFDRFPGSPEGANLVVNLGRYQEATGLRRDRLLPRRSGRRRPCRTCPGDGGAAVGGRRGQPDPHRLVRDGPRQGPVEPDGAERERPGRTRVLVHGADERRGRRDLRLRADRAASQGVRDPSSAGSADARSSRSWCWRRPGSWRSADWSPGSSWDRGSRS